MAPGPDVHAQLDPRFPRPAPAPDEVPFWDGCRAHELRLQRCSRCGTFRHPPRPRCPECRSAELIWEVVSGRGVIASYTICYPPVLPAFADKVPYNAVVVELEEGPFIVSNAVGVANDGIVVGMPVEVTFVDLDDELTLPQFRPAS
jgi:uncharacterized OB-fold protein